MAYECKESRFTIPDFEESTHPYETRSTALAGLCFCVVFSSRRSIQSVLLPVVNITDLAGKNGNGNGRCLLPRYDMEDPSHLKNPIS